MPEDKPDQPAGWSEGDSEDFIDYAHYFIPDRRTQIDTIRDLIPPKNGTFNVLELGCGEGLLAEAILEKFPFATVYGYDGSEAMLSVAHIKLAPFEQRFQSQHFDLADDGWRRPPWPLHAVVSSLVIHHLSSRQKQALYTDVYRMLSPGGVFLIADLVLPANKIGVALAAQAWDVAVRERAIRFDENEQAYNAFRRLQWNMYRYPDPADKPDSLIDQLKWLEKSGFVDVDVFWMRAGHTIFGGRV